MLHVNLWCAGAGRSSEEDDEELWMAANKSYHPQRRRPPTTGRGICQHRSPCISRYAWRMSRIRFGGPLFFDGYRKPNNRKCRKCRSFGLRYFRVSLNLEVRSPMGYVGVETTFKTDDTKISTSSHEVMRFIAFSYPTQDDEESKTAERWIEVCSALSSLQLVPLGAREGELKHL